MLRLLAVLALISPGYAQTPKHMRTTLRLMVVVLGVFVVMTFLRHIAEERLSIMSACAPNGHYLGCDVTAGK
jgi:hypothetical protein